MPISNTQYDAIMHGYSEKQLHNRQLAADRQRLAYIKVPRLKEIEDHIATASVASVRRRFAGDSSATQKLQAELAELRKEKARLLQSIGYPADYLDPIYDCPDCKDTGYINGQKCHCMRQAIIDVVYAQSNLYEILKKENFSNFSMRYYSDDIVNPATGLSARANMEMVVDQCKTFITDFDHKPKNMLFYGDTGVGKTFLSNCIASELLKRGYSVVYFSAFQLFEFLSRQVFDRDAEAISAHQNIFDCDLLIIDDLGTELTNNFTVPQLFLCVNERILRNKSTIISTNLGINLLKNTYSERIFSRIADNYTICKLYGDDIRLKKFRQQ